MLWAYARHYWREVRVVAKARTLVTVAYWIHDGGSLVKQQLQVQWPRARLADWAERARVGGDAMSGRVLGFPDPGPADEANPTSAAVGAMGAGTAESPAYRRREDRDRFEGQARAWAAFRETKRTGGDDAAALAAALDVFYEAMLVAAVRRFTGK